MSFLLNYNFNLLVWKDSGLLKEVNIEIEKKADSKIGLFTVTDELLLVFHLEPFRRAALHRDYTFLHSHVKRLFQWNLDH
jgi:hypothetical protein